MELNKQKTSDKNVEEEFSIKTIEDLYKKTLKIGKYTFRIKNGLKGKELFMLTNTFGITVDDKNTLKSMRDIFQTFGENYEIALNYFEYSINGVDFVPLLINNLCQVPEIETNVAFMYQLFIHLQVFAVLFTEISQQQLNDMQ